MKILEFTKIDPETDIENVFLGNLKKSDERDTDIEHEIDNIIHRYVSSTHSPNIREKMYDLLVELQKIKHLYPKDLIPNIKYAYRGTQCKFDVYDKLLKKYPGYTKGIVEFPFTYTPKGKVQSWTGNLAIAKIFAKYDVMDEDQENYFENMRTCPAIIKVKVDDSFIMSTHIMKYYGTKTIGRNEFEILRMGNNPINAEIVVNGEHLYHYKKALDMDLITWS